MGMRGDTLLSAGLVAMLRLFFVSSPAARDEELYQIGHQGAFEADFPRFRGPAVIDLRVFDPSSLAAASFRPFGRAGRSPRRPGGSTERFPSIGRPGSTDPRSSRPCRAPWDSPPRRPC